MEKEKINQMQKKDVRIGVRISPAEKEALEAFCLKMGIALSELVRYSIRQVVNEKSKM
jgi:antitoxin component of RelBE/YafQ-DinJ toxin-antitoxin module